MRTLDCALTISAAGIVWRNSITSLGSLDLLPNIEASLKVLASTFSISAQGHVAIPLWRMALWKRPRDTSNDKY